MINLDVSCRLCLNCNSKNINLLENENDENLSSIVNNIFQYLNLRISGSDLLPTTVCSVCIEKLTSWDAFHLRCHENQETLIEWLQNKQGENIENSIRDRSASPLLIQSVSPSMVPFYDDENESDVEIKQEVIDNSYDGAMEFSYSTFPPQDYSIETEPSHLQVSKIEENLSTNIEKTSSNLLEYNFDEIKDVIHSGECKYCFKHCKGLKAMASHLRKYHMNIPLYICWACGKCCGSKTNITKHRFDCPKQTGFKRKVKVKPVKSIIDENSQQVVKYSCYVCAKLFSTIDEWTEHKNTNCEQVLESKINEGSTRTYNDWLNLDLSEKIQNIYYSDPIGNQVNVQETAKKIYECRDCGEKFDKTNLYAAHRNSHAAEIRSKNRIACRRCKQTFTLKSNLNRHLKKCLKKPTVVINKQFDKHSITHSSARTYSCPYCPSVFSGSSSFYRHIDRCPNKPSDFKTFSKIHPEAIKCTKCKELFRNQLAYKKHLLECQGYNATITLKCSNCGRVCSNRTGLHQHSLICYFRTNSICYVCNNHFNNLDKFKKHYLEQHKTNIKLNKTIPLGSKSYRCKRCRKVLYSVESYRAHINEHYRESNECKYCHKTFSLARNLNAHIVICSKKAQNGSTNDQMKFDRNQESSSANGPLTIQCALCTNTFTTMSALREHILNAHQTDTFEKLKKKTHFCEFCNMGFMKLANLTEHISKYHREVQEEGEFAAPPILQPAVPNLDSFARSWICGTCQLTFENDESLAVHEMTCHAIEYQ